MSLIRFRAKFMRYWSPFVISFVLGCFVSAVFFHNYKCQSRDDNEKDVTDYILVLLILSAPGNSERRNTIRETWLNLRPSYINSTSYQNEQIFIPKYAAGGLLEHETVEEQKQLLTNYKGFIRNNENRRKVRLLNNRIKHLFVIGTRKLEISLLQDLKNENKLYNDLLLIDNLIDSYDNLTIKLLTSIKLVESSYNYTYLMKCDDDTYVKLDLLTQDLINYNEKKISSQHASLGLELYWGFFNGRSRIKSLGQWKETKYNICDRYLPYALGGGYVLSYNLTKYIAEYHQQLAAFVSEDISIGTWLAPFRNIHRRHDVRFDTGYLPRNCETYHLVLHKRNSQHMRDIFKGDLCTHQALYEKKTKPNEYYYDWSQSPLKCCDKLTL